jgi:hypothetical protein
MAQTTKKGGRGRGNFGRSEQHREAGRLGGLARARNLRARKREQRQEEDME